MGTCACAHLLARFAESRRYIYHYKLHGFSKIQKCAKFAQRKCCTGFFSNCICIEIGCPVFDEYVLLIASYIYVCVGVLLLASLT